MLLDVQIEHPGDQRPLQPRAGALQHVEARAAELDAALEVDDVQLRAEIPVRLRLEVERPRLPFFPDDHVLGVARPDRHAGVRQIRDAQHGVLQVRFHLRQLFIQRLDLIADGRHVRLQRLPLGALPIAHELADLLRAAVALGAQHFHAHQDRPPALIQRQRLRHRRILGSQGPHRSQDRVPVFADELDIQHDPLPFSDLRSRTGCKNKAPHIHDKPMVGSVRDEGRSWCHPGSPWPRSHSLERSRRLHRNPQPAIGGHPATHTLSYVKPDRPSARSDTRTFPGRSSGVDFSAASCCLAPTGSSLKVM